MSVVRDALRSPYLGSVRVLAQLAPAIAIFALNGGCSDAGKVGQLHAVLAVDPAWRDYGDVPVGVRSTATFTVRNTGNATLTLKDLRIEVASSASVGLRAATDGAGLTGGTPPPASASVFRIVNETARRLPPAASDIIIVEAAPAVEGLARAELVVEPQGAVLAQRVPIRVSGVKPPPCDDGNVCTTDSFDAEKNECVHTFADGLSCEAADKCIVEAVCSQGVCLGRSKVCNDHDACTRDFCRQSTGECVFITDPNACDDNNPCTADSCNASGCRHEPVLNGTPCDLGDACTRGAACFAGTCRGTTVADGSPCDDHDSCTVDDRCRAGVCAGRSIIQGAREGDVVFTYNLTPWPRAFLHRREVSMSDDGIFYGLDHLPLTNPPGLSHVAFAMKQCGSEVYQFAYRPPDSHVFVRYVRREMQLQTDNKLRLVVGVRQLIEDGFRPETTTYVIDEAGNAQLSQIQTLGGETGRALLPDGSHIFGVIWPLTSGPPTPEMDSRQNLVVVRQDRAGNVLWRHERDSSEWAEFLGVAGPRVLFWARGRFGALDFNTGHTVWSSNTPHITKEMALSTNLNLGVARASTQLIGVEILQGRPRFAFPRRDDPSYVPRTDPVIAADGRVLVLMQRNSADKPVALEWVELAADGTLLASTPLPYTFPADPTRTASEDDPYPTVADDGISYVGYGDQFWAIEPGGRIRWTLTSTIPNAFTGTVPLLRDDGVLLISQFDRVVKGIRTNGGKMSATGWASFRHDRRRTNFTP